MWNGTDNKTYYAMPKLFVFLYKKGGHKYKRYVARFWAKTI